MDPNDIEGREFTTAPRGYDREEVDSFLRVVGAEVRRLQTALKRQDAAPAPGAAALWSRGEPEAGLPSPDQEPDSDGESSTGGGPDRSADGGLHLGPQRRPDRGHDPDQGADGGSAPADPIETYRQVGDHTAGILVAAEEAATQIRKRGQREAAELLADAREEAAALARAATVERDSVAEDIRQLQEARSLLGTEMEDMRRRFEELVLRLRQPFDVRRSKPKTPDATRTSGAPPRAAEGARAGGDVPRPAGASPARPPAPPAPFAPGSARPAAPPAPSPPSAPAAGKRASPAEHFLRGSAGSPGEKDTASLERDGREVVPHADEPSPALAASSQPATLSRPPVPAAPAASAEPPASPQPAGPAQPTSPAPPAPAASSAPAVSVGREAVPDGEDPVVLVRAGARGGAQATPFEAASGNGSPGSRAPEAPPRDVAGLRELPPRLEAPGDPQEVLAWRASALGGLPVDAARLLKRLLHQDQSELLERLRAWRGAGPAASHVPQPDLHTARFAQGLGDVLEAAFRVGRWAGGSADPGDAVPTIEALVTKQLVTPLRRDLVRLIEPSAGSDTSPTAASKRASDVYRVWKGVRTDLLGEGLVYAVFHQGLIRAATEAAASRNGSATKEWVVSADEGNCPREVCSANASAGPVDLDTPFPSGHLVPPAHGGCSCTLLLVRR